MLTSRRRFLQRAATTAGIATGLGEWAPLLPLGPASAAEATVTPDLVRFSPDIEPVVRAIEDTPREDCPAMMIDRLRKGLSYRQFLAALYLANIRTSEVSHPLAVLHSTNQLTLDLPVHERLLPTLWAMDSFKFHRARGDFSNHLRTLTGAVPSAATAEAEFRAGMDAFDAERAEHAIVALVRSQGMNRISELLCRYAARDWTFIGHFSIWVANCWRTLDTIGWAHAEASLRVVVTSIVGEDSKLNNQPYWKNQERVRKSASLLPANWSESGADEAFTRELIDAIRELKADDACELVASRLREGKVRAGAVWDAVHLAAGEMFMCAQKNSEPLHANTAANALHHLFDVSGDTETRLLILLQAVGWMGLYRSALVRKGWLKEPKRITDLVEASIPDQPQEAVEAILGNISFGGGKPTADPLQGTKGPEFNSQPWRYEAARKVFAFARRFPSPQPLVHAAWRMLPLKADWDPHRIKFPVAVWENWSWVSPVWRPHMLAAASYSFIGADAPDTALATQVREAIKDL